MKKSLAFLVAVMVAGLVSAGTVSWYCYDAMKDGSYIDGGVAYLFIGDSTAGVADAIQGGTFDFGSALATATTDDEGCFEKTKIGSFASQTVSTYMVLFDTASVAKDSNFVVSSVKTQTFGASGNKTYDFSESIDLKSWTPVTPGPVPEPCSVALVALGLAAFGLKRKVA